MKVETQSSLLQSEQRHSLGVALNALSSERAAATEAELACSTARDNYCSELKQQYAMLSGKAADAIANERQDVAQQAQILLTQRDSFISQQTAELNQQRQATFHFQSEAEAIRHVELASAAHEVQMKNDIASAYGITPEEVTMTVDYVAKGTLKMTFNSSTMTEQEAMDSITKAIR